MIHYANMIASSSKKTSSCVTKVRYAERSHPRHKPKPCRLSDKNNKSSLSSLLVVINPTNKETDDDESEASIQNEPSENEDDSSSIHSNELNEADLESIDKSISSEVSDDCSSQDEVRSFFSHENQSMRLNCNNEEWILDLKYDMTDTDDSSNHNLDVSSAKNFSSNHFQDDLTENKSIKDDKSYTKKYLNNDENRRKNFSEFTSFQTLSYQLKKNEKNNDAIFKNRKTKHIPIQAPPLRTFSSKVKVKPSSLIKKNTENFIKDNSGKNLDNVESYEIKVVETDKDFVLEVPNIKKGNSNKKNSRKKLDSLSGTNKNKSDLSFIGVHKISSPIVNSSKTKGIIQSPSPKKTSSSNLETCDKSTNNKSLREKSINNIPSNTELSKFKEVISVSLDGKFFISNNFDFLG